MIIIMETPNFLGYQATMIPVDLLPLKQLLLNLFPRLPQFYFTLNTGIPHILSSIIFSLKYSLLLMTPTLLLNPHSQLQKSPKSKLYAYLIIYYTSPWALKFMSRTQDLPSKTCFSSMSPFKILSPSIVVLIRNLRCHSITLLSLLPVISHYNLWILPS